jgi:hypothetical protein
LTQISVTRALAQVKSLGERINREFQTQFISSTTGGKHATGDAQVIGDRMKASLQSVNDMIAQRSKLKSAIVKSNSVTTVEINGVKMTVAEAIERKTGIVYEQTFVQTLTNQLNQQSAKVERENIQVNARLDQLIQTTIGKDRKVNEDEVSAIRDPFLKANKAELLDPSNLRNVIDALSAKIDGFLLEVDYALSEINAVTKISVE